MLLRHMMNELRRIGEWFVTPFAGVSFSGVEEHVLVEIRLLAVRFLAICASELLFTRAMDLHVHRQTGCLRKCFVTLFARKWLFTGVYSHMCI